jgi:hypothetical protein
VQWEAPVPAVSNYVVNARCDFVRRGVVPTARLLFTLGRFSDQTFTVVVMAVG